MVTFSSMYIRYFFLLPSRYSCFLTVKFRKFKDTLKSDIRKFSRCLCLTIFYFPYKILLICFYKRCCLFVSILSKLHTSNQRGEGHNAHGGNVTRPCKKNQQLSIQSSFVIVWLYNVHANNFGPTTQHIPDFMAISCNVRFPCTLEWLENEIQDWTPNYNYF